MKTNADTLLGNGTVALTSDELREARGGNQWLIALAVGIGLALWDGADTFVQGVQEGYHWARANG